MKNEKHLNTPINISKLKDSLFFMKDKKSILNKKGD